MAGRLLLVVVVSLTLLVAPSAGSAQQPTKVPTIGVLNLSGPQQPEGRMTVDVFRQALGERGYVEGRNIVIEHRWADGKGGRLPALAAELVQRKVDLIVAGATPQARAAKQATATIPIVAWAMQAPVQVGLVAGGFPRAGGGGARRGLLLWRG